MFATRQKTKPMIASRPWNAGRRNGRQYARRRPAPRERHVDIFSFSALKFTWLKPWIKFGGKSLNKPLEQVKNSIWSGIKGLDWQARRFNMLKMDWLSSHKSPTRRTPGSMSQALKTRANSARKTLPKSGFKSGAIKWSSVLSVVLVMGMTPSESRNLDWRHNGLALNRADMVAAIGDSIRKEQYPSAALLDVYGKQTKVQLHYSFDPVVQTTADSLFARYKPDYGAFAAIDPETGRILALASYIKGHEDLGNLAIRGSFPAASVFKTVTAAAALDQHKLNTRSVLPFNGKSTTLYKRQVLRHRNNKWTRHPTLKEAYAKSMNPVFARIGVYTVGGETLKQYAEKFGFNQAIHSDVAFDTGKTRIDPHNDWSIAEAASGFTRKNTLSPLHGAMLAAAVVNDGVMMKPFIVSTGMAEQGMLLYQPEPEQVGQPISASTARAMRQLMRQTVKSGTARKSFRRFLKKHRDLDVGGKTGTLTGLHPKGKTDWFIGYAEKNGKKIAYASVTVNKEKWTVKSHYVARRVVQAWLAGMNTNVKVANGN